MKLTKRMKDTTSLVEKQREYAIREGVALLKKTAKAKFNESIDIAVRLGVDPKKSDQMIRGTASLPHGIGKSVRVLVLTRPAKQQEARDAGAEHVGLEDYLEKIQEGWADIDVIIATPDVMGEVGKLGKVLGPRGLMPNPKSGTVTTEVGQAVTDVKGGKISFRVDKGGIVHAMVGKVNFDEDKIVENVQSFITTLNRMKPAAAKGVYIKGVTLSSTMGPGIHLDRSEASLLH
ncbi:MAG: 50S ribosomal protein L1 [Bacteroidota bacterium]|jgi:large subunit ribosomal protein L1|nr:50S ribosomal protein L1 [Bacteroidota bacterium]